MTTKQVADRLVDLYNQGKAVQAEEELYAHDVISHEMTEGQIVRGKEAVIAKTQQAFSATDVTWHRNEAANVAINNDSFLVEFVLDMEPQGGQRQTITEYGFYRLRDGLVSEEYFFVF